MTYPVGVYYDRLKAQIRMENAANSSVVKWLKQNWFKVALVGCVGSLMLVKDLRFQVDLKAPTYLTNTTDAEETSTASTSLLEHGRNIGTRLAGAITAPVKQLEDIEVKDVQATKEQNAGFNNLGNTYSNMTYKEEKKLSVKRTAKIIKQEAYVQRFASVAQAEMKKFGIPASITLAQGLIESNAGDSRLSQEINNHFGMKCFSRTCRKGHCKNFTDDTHKDFFRAYGTAWESYRAHSNMLQGKRYRGLKKHGIDYKAWAHGLKKAGYATDPRYAQKLILLIEQLDLTQYDQL